MKDFCFNELVVKDFGETDLDGVVRFLYNNVRLWSMTRISEDTIICDLKDFAQTCDFIKFTLEKNVHLITYLSFDDNSKKITMEAKNGVVNIF